MGRKQYKILFTLCVLIIVAGYFILFFKDSSRTSATKIYAFGKVALHKDVGKSAITELGVPSRKDINRKPVTSDKYVDERKVTSTKEDVPVEKIHDRVLASSKFDASTQKKNNEKPKSDKSDVSIQKKSTSSKVDAPALQKADVKPTSSKFKVLNQNRIDRKLSLRHDVSNVTSAGAVLQVPNGTLSMIEQIESQHEALHGEINVVDLEIPKCEPGGTPVNGVEDILCMKPPSFLPSSKNPCWLSTGKKLRCMPYFQVVGMDKCGSTDLFDRIAKHPDVQQNDGVLGKETMWWSWLRYGHWLLEDYKKKVTFERYVNYFDSAAKRIAANMSAGIVTGDGTPMDMWDFSGWVMVPQNAPTNQPVFLTPRLIKHVNPNVKLLIILRDPVERLFSDYFFLNVGKMTTEAFHSNLLKSIDVLADCSQTMSLKLCLFNRGIHVHLPVRIHLGFYSVFLREWLKVFPREQIYILRTEDYSSNMRKSLEDIYQFLNLRKLPDTLMTQFAESSKKHVTKRKEKVKMLPESRVIIQRLYKMFNEELATILNDQKYTWPNISQVNKPPA